MNWISVNDRLPEEDELVLVAVIGCDKKVIGGSEMKKRTDEEKRQMVDDACDLIRDGIEKIRQAEKMLHLCGIDICSYVDVGKHEDWNTSSSHIQIHTGIPKMEKLVGAKAYFPNDCITEKPDRSRKKLKYKGIVFIQLASESKSKFGYK